MRARTGLSLALLALLLTVACGGGGTAVLSPHTVANRNPVDHTEQVILDTLPRQGWTAETVQPGRIVAFFSRSAHLLRVEIRYDVQSVAIYYLDSDNLKAHLEANGQIYGHSAINRWSDTLARAIAGALMGPAPGTP